LVQNGQFCGKKVFGQICQKTQVFLKLMSFCSRPRLLRKHSANLHCRRCLTVDDTDHTQGIAAGDVIRGPSSSRNGRRAARSATYECRPEMPHRSPEGKLNVNEPALAVYAMLMSLACLASRTLNPAVARNCRQPSSVLSWSCDNQTFEMGR